MPKYLVRADYTSEGAKGLLHGGGTARVKAAQEFLASVNGRVESFYFAFGDDDAYIIIDAPDDISAAALSLTVLASGAIRSATTVLIAPEEIDQAIHKHLAFHAPGKET
jgi:uncharacterized protein with GYD domain